MCFTTDERLYAPGAYALSDFGEWHRWVLRMCLLGSAIVGADSTGPIGDVAKSTNLSKWKGRGGKD